MTEFIGKDQESSQKKKKGKDIDTKAERQKDEYDLQIYNLYFSIF